MNLISRLVWREGELNVFFARLAVEAVITAERFVVQADPHTSVTFISFACSGATIESGLIGEQQRGTVVLRPQIEKVAASLNGRSVDALIVSIGGNDIGFEKLVVNMVKPNCSNDIDPGDLLGKGFAQLPGLYEKLNKAIRDVLPLTKIFITEYPNIVRDQTGKLCDRRPTADVLRGVCEREAAAAEGRIIQPLNAAVNTAATTWNWIYVGGIASAFRLHGYCADDQRWALTNRDSLHVQRDIHGTLHPNKGGHAWYATRLIEEMRASGVTTPPAH